VTASRLANEPLRQGGIKMTEAMQKAIRINDEATLRKDILEADANRRRRAAFQKTWRSPVSGPAPIAPALEGGPSTGALVLGLAASAVGSFGESWFGSNPDIKSKGIVQGSFSDVTKQQMLNSPVNKRGILTTTRLG
jgi:hypothetical protein